MELSSGARKDLLVATFARSLLTIGRHIRENTMDELKGVKPGQTVDTGKIVERQSNKTYKVNKRLDRRFDKLEDALNETATQLMDPKTAQWQKDNVDKRIGKLLYRIQSEDINPESLAVNILFSNFVEREKPLHEAMAWLAIPGQYYDIEDLIEETPAEEVTQRMFIIAKESVAEIKR